MIAIILAHVPAVLLLAAGHPWPAFAALAAGHAFLLLGTLVPGIAWFVPVRTRFTPPEDERSVWLTFDDGPDPETTPDLIELLASSGAKATFFLIGERARQFPELVRAIQAAGHEIANHTESHPAKSFWRLGSKRLRQELGQAQESLVAITGQRPSRFRAPAGMHNPLLSSALRSFGLGIEGWSHRGFDGTSTDPEAIMARLSRDLRPGSIFLLHEGRPTTLECSRRLLEILEGESLVPRIPEN